MDTKAAAKPKPINHRERTAGSAAKRVARDAATLSSWLAANPTWSTGKQAVKIKSAIAAAKALGATPASK